MLIVTEGNRRTLSGYTQEHPPPGRSTSQREAKCTCFILAKNAGKTIRRCLDSALKADCFKKILVILDTRSSDTTSSIVRGYSLTYPTVRVFNYKWTDPPDFAAARNFALSKIQTAYGLWLDADEWISDPECLMELLSKPGPAYLIVIKSPLGNGATCDMMQPRLFPLRPGLAFECPVFERLDWSLVRAGVRLKPTDCEPISHDGYSDNSVLRQKNRRNLQILKAWLRKKGRSWFREFVPETDQDKHLMEQYRKLI